MYRIADAPGRSEFQESVVDQAMSSLKEVRDYVLSSLYVGLLEVEGTRWRGVQPERSN